MIPFIEVLVFREEAFELNHHPWEVGAETDCVWRKLN